jgi:hypothetical protein
MYRTHPSQYWLIHDPDDAQQLVGVAKVSRKGVEDDTPFGYFNDIAVRASDQANGYGWALAHAALKFGLAPLSRPLALDGYAGSDVTTVGSKAGNGVWWHGELIRKA